MRLLPLLLLASCLVLDVDRWPEARRAALCRVEVQCFDRHEDFATCEASLAAADDGTCEDFDLFAANDCLRILRRHASDCPAASIAEWQIPATCAEVCL